MRKYYHIQLATQDIKGEELQGADIARAGRYHIAKTLLEDNIATVDPLSPDNMLIFSAGPFAGTSFSNANRIAVGAKSPLTGGIKEANGGGTFAYAMGQLHIAGFNLYGVSDDWTVIHFHKDGAITFDDATPYMGKGTFETAALLHEKYGKKVSLGICGPISEYLGLLGGISFSDIDRRPSRIAARGGIGAVMGSKKVKAIVVDMDKMPMLHDRKKSLQDVRTYAKLLQDNEGIMSFFNEIGTMAMADFTNHIGGLPTNNFSSGQQTNHADGKFKMGGDYIANLNRSRGGIQTHACMPGCVIQCSNVYYDDKGEEVASPIEYETLCLLGTNCGIEEPDQLAALNYVANDLGIDTIETGATLAVLMEAGLAEFGDFDFMKSALKAIKDGTDDGKLWAQGTARVGEHYGVKRVPVIKKQAISAYDPRVIEGTGISMMTTAQGADHTVGYAYLPNSTERPKEEIIAHSFNTQVSTATVDSLGICTFGNGVTKANTEFIVDAINNAHNAGLDYDFFMEMGRETLRMEREFNLRAGFGEQDDGLPAFFYEEGLPPTNNKARFTAQDVHSIFDSLMVKE